MGLAEMILTALCGFAALLLVISALIVVYAVWSSEVDSGNGEWM